MSKDLSFLHSKLLSVDAVEAATEIAELAKDEEWRDAIGNSELITAVAQLISPSELEITVQLLRCIGNLSFDNGFNRDMISETHGTVERILQCIDIHSQLTVSVLLNLTMENATTQKMVVELDGISKILSKIKELKDENIDFTITGLRLIANLLEIDSGREKFLTAGGLDSLSVLLRHYLLKILEMKKSNETFSCEVVKEQINVLDSCGMILETIIDDDNVQREIITSGMFLKDFCWIIQELNNLMSVENDYTLLDGDYFSTYEFQEELADLLKDFCVLVTLLSLNDFCMKDMVSNSEIINTFKSWMQAEQIVQRYQLEVIVAAVLSLGNLARTDETCHQLLTEYAIDGLLNNLLSGEVGRLKKDHPLSSEKLIQAILSALKNLTLADSCKEILSSPLLFQSIMELLEFPQGNRLTVTCISIIKNLTTGRTDFKNIFELMLNSDAYDEEADGTHSLLKRINVIAWCSADEADGNIRNECGRVNANLIKLIHKHNFQSLGRILIKYGCITLLIQMITGFILSIPPTHDMLDSDFSSESYVDFQSSRIFKTYSIVQNEGIVALVLLCSFCSEAVPIIVKYRTPLMKFFESTLKRTESASTKTVSTLDSITALNASHLLLILCQKDEDIRTIANERFGDMITSINRMATSIPQAQLNSAQKNESPFPKDIIGMRQIGRKLPYHEASRYSKELEINMDQQGGLIRALNIENSADSLEIVTGSLLDIFQNEKLSDDIELPSKNK